MPFFIVAIAFITTPTPVATAQVPADLDAARRDCLGQLADWQTCASASTPAGKAKIKQLSDRLQSIDAQVAKAERAKGSAPADTASKAAPAATPSDAKGAPHPTLGTRLDVYA